MTARTGTVVPLVWDILSARAAMAAGARAAFLSGGYLSAARGVPDGLMTADEVIDAARDIIHASDLTLLIDGETGYGPLPALARFVERLVAAGVGGIMVEDHESTMGTGPTMPMGKGLCSTEVHVARVRTVKEAAAGRAKIIARTDILTADQPFSETLARLQAYVDAGADWVFPVLVRSASELGEVARRFPGRTMAIGVKGTTGYAPNLTDVNNAGVQVLIPARQQLFTFPRLLEAYELSMRGDTDELLAKQMDGKAFAKIMGFDRYTRWDH